MSEAEWSDQARWIILEYLQPSHVTLPEMEEIHQRITGEERDFTRWNKVAGLYAGMDWNHDQFRRFLQIAKETVEGGIDEIAETYFEIVVPENITRTELVETLSEEKWDPDEGDSQISITFHERDDGIIVGEFIYETVNTDITDDFSVRRFQNTKPVPFRIDAEEQLVIVESTSASRVQRLRGALNHETALQLNICGNLTLFPGMANDKIELFRSEFNDENSAGPFIRQIRDVFMYNPSTEADDIKKIDYQGGDNGDIFDHDTIEDRRNEDWIIRGFLAKMGYQSDVLEVSIAGTSQMGYIKVSDISNIDSANELMTILREKYMEHIR